jgi:D-alanyl-D-alanine carboxypeptidase/D-alanyl-D-alanine-endopeptidase (penicillin-binding protein 4)
MPSAHPAGASSAALVAASGGGLAGTLPGAQVLAVAEALDPDATMPSEAAIADAAARTVLAETLTAASGAAAIEGEPAIPAELAGGLGVSVRDLLTGQELFGLDGGRGLVPASTVKVLTATAALSALGPNATLTTAAVLSLDPGGATGTVTLVAGGDVTLGPDAGDPEAVLGRAGMGDLARAAAIEVRRSGLRAVTVALDDTIFSGPSTYPDWEWNLGTTWGAPASPLAIMDGRAGDGFDAVTYVPDPALTAARHFAGLLAAAAVDPALSLPPVAVDPEASRAAAPAGARQIAAVESAPVRELVAHLLRHSDNTLAEAVGRVTAVALGQPGSFAGCAAAVKEALGQRGVPTAGLSLDDCSGLSHGSRLSASTLTAALALAGGSAAAELGGAARALPVGGLQGTLAERLTEAPAAGNVRAKTGTLTGVTSLAGLVQTASGRELAFAVLANPDQRVGTFAIRQATDAFAQSLAALP